MPQTSEANHKYKIRTLIAFWLLGLCNNYGYVVMLSAAHDIIKNLDQPTQEGTLSHLNDNNQNSTKRACNEMSTGAILLADIVPSLFIKLIAPFFPLVIHIRLVITLLLSAAGYILVGQAKTTWVAIFGVVCTALSAGLGEVSLLAYMSSYKTKNVISTWSSGTGGAGIFGSFSFLLFTSILKLQPDITMYLMLVVPVIMAISFWIIAESPQNEADNLSTINSTFDNSDPDIVDKTKSSFFGKLKAVPSLFKYMVPLCLVYLFEYFINQGLFELVQIDNAPSFVKDYGDQYKYYQVIYQVGVFISRSSINLVEIDQTWIFAVLQGLNVAIFTCQAIYNFIPIIYVIFILILWEGLLGGGTYVNTYNRIMKEASVEEREFAMSMTSLSDAIGISIAGFAALPTHNAICYLPKY